MQTQPVCSCRLDSVCKTFQKSTGADSCRLSQYAAADSASMKLQTMMTQQHGFILKMVDEKIKAFQIMLRLGSNIKTFILKAFTHIIHNS